MPFMGQKSKNQKSKYVFWKRMKSLRKESVLISSSIHQKGEVVFHLELTCFHTNPKKVIWYSAGWPVGNCDYIAKLQLKLSLAKAHMSYPEEPVIYYIGCWVQLKAGWVFTLKKGELISYNF